MRSTHNHRRVPREDIGVDLNKEAIGAHDGTQRIGTLIMAGLSASQVELAGG